MLASPTGIGPQSITRELAELNEKDEANEERRRRQLRS